MTPDGHLILFLHAHLPFVRHPEDENIVEENWLYEAIAGNLPAAAAGCRSLAAG